MRERESEVGWQLTNTVNILQRGDHECLNEIKSKLQHHTLFRKVHQAGTTDDVQIWYEVVLRPRAKLKPFCGAIWCKTISLENLRGIQDSPVMILVFRPISEWRQGMMAGRHIKQIIRQQRGRGKKRWSDPVWRCNLSKLQPATLLLLWANFSGLAQDLIALWAFKIAELGYRLFLLAEGKSHWQIII